MDELFDFNKQCIEAHNGLREEHESPPLQYNEQLALAAQAYAEKIAKSGNMVHSSESERGAHVGENLATEMSQYKSFVFSGLAATSMWYSEIKDYNFDLEVQKSSSPTGHFTQVVWKDTKEAGFGRMFRDNGDSVEWFIVGRYAPAGNFIGNYKANVPILMHYTDWHNTSIIQEYLKEQKYWEFTNGRRHILDDVQMKMATKMSGNKTVYKITEIFQTPNGETYEETIEADENPRLSTMDPHDFVEAHCKNTEKKPYNFLDSYEHDSHSSHSNSQLGLMDGDNDEDEMKRNNSLNSYSTSDHEDVIDEILDLVSNENMKVFIEQVLEYHNYYRSLHGIRNLTLDKQLSRFAQDWSNTMAKEDKMEFSQFIFRTAIIGENISIKQTPLNSESGRKIVDSWYKEREYYKYNDEPENFSEIGHFSQLIWKKSRKLGVGIAQSNRTNHYYIACFYYPPGNVVGQFEENVLQPL